MGLIVQKYGGSSVGTADLNRKVAACIVKRRAEGYDVVVVVSAMGGETDRLLALADRVATHPVDRELDMLLSSGERVTSALLAMALQEQGCAAQSLTGRQVGIVTDSSHTNARIMKIAGDRVRETLAEGKVPVVAGFQGIDQKSDVTTLGRGGSDLTAVALAAALGAEQCEIYTDVDGVYTADPSIVPSARRLDRISYEEMLEMASLGAEVLQTRSVEFAKTNHVSVLVKSAFANGAGTLVGEEDADMDKLTVSGVTCDRDQTKITVSGVPDRPGVAAALFGAVADGNIVVDMIIQNVSHDGMTDISFTVPQAGASKAVKIAQRVAEEVGVREVLVTEGIAKVSIVGVGMRTHSGVASRMFHALAREGVNIMMISTSEIKISCVIGGQYSELAVRTLHDTFELGRASG